MTLSWLAAWRPHGGSTSRSLLSPCVQPNVESLSMDLPKAFLRSWRTLGSQPLRLLIILSDFVRRRQAGHGAQQPPLGQGSTRPNSVSIPTSLLPFQETESSGVFLEASVGPQIWRPTTDRSIPSNVRARSLNLPIELRRIPDTRVFSVKRLLHHPQPLRLNIGTLGLIHADIST